MQLKKLKKKQLKQIPFLVAFFLIGLFYWQNIKTNSIHVDEMTYILRGRFLDLYLAGDFANPDWQSFDSYEVAKLIEYFYGFSTKIYSGTSVSKHISHPDFDYVEGRYLRHYDQLEVTETDKLNIQTILNARHYNLIFFILPSIILTFLIGKKISGAKLSLLATSLFYSNTIVVAEMNHATSDAALFFFSLLFVFSLTTFLEQRTQIVKNNQEKQWIILLGLVAGLATSSKLNGGINVIVFFLSLIYLKLKNIINWQKLTVFALIFGSVAFLVFFIINPYLWSQPLSGSLKMIDTRMMLNRNFSLYWPQLGLPNLQARTGAVLKRVFGLQSWHAFLGRFLNLYLLDATLFIAALVAIIKNKKRKAAQTVLLIWIFCLMIITTLLIPMDWQRYYMPVMLGLTLLEPYGFNFLLKTFKLHEKV